VLLLQLAMLLLDLELALFELAQAGCRERGHYRESRESPIGERDVG
jgi:hypothetical protein